MKLQTRWGALLATAAIAALTNGVLLQAGARSEKAEQKRAAKTIQWQPSLAAAEKESRETGKPVMVVFHASWCGACRMLEQQTLTNPKVIEAAQKWVTVKVDVDQEKEIAAQFGIRSLPTTGFLRADGGPKLGFVGAAGPQDMVKVMEAAHARLEKSKAGTQESGGKTEQ